MDINYKKGKAFSGIKENVKSFKDIKVTDIEITDIEVAKLLGRDKGRYITVEFPSLNHITDLTDLRAVILDTLKKIMPNEYSNILLVGLGNTDITPDAIGPLTAEKILATRHIAGEFSKSIGLEGLNTVSVLSPNVLGKTGIESTELILSAVKLVKPQIVIAVDALATNNVSRLYRTVQLCNTGISPGSGVKNSRKEISQKTLGVPVIAVGVPTVSDFSDNTDEDMFITPKDVDLLTNRITEILSASINVFLQPKIDKEVILSLV